MRPVHRPLAAVFGVAILLIVVAPGPLVAQEAASPSASVAPSASAVPSASVEPSASLLADARIELHVNSETDPVRSWAVAVTGGIPSVDAVTVPDPVNGYALFAVTIFGQSATVELTATLPAGSQLSAGTCFDYDAQVERDVIVVPRRLVVEVVRGNYYECLYGSDARGVPEPTTPPTDSLAGAQKPSSSHGWPMIIFMAAFVAASLLMAVRDRLRS